MTDRRRLRQAKWWLRLRIPMKVIPTKPKSIIAQVDGSGTAATCSVASPNACDGLIGASVNTVKYKIGAVEDAARVGVEDRGVDAVDGGTVRTRSK